MKIKQVIKTEYSSWKRLIITKKNGKCTYNDINIKLPSTTILNHYGIGVVIGERVKLGKFVTIGQNVTIGSIKGKQPTIEDYVIIHAHSIVIGDIVVGHHSVIGAGAVVYKDVPAYSLVVGYCKIYKGKYKK